MSFSVGVRMQSTAGSFCSIQAPLSCMAPAGRSVAILLLAMIYSVIVIFNVYFAAYGANGRRWL